MARNIAEIRERRQKERAAATRNYNRTPSNESASVAQPPKTPNPNENANANPSKISILSRLNPLKLFRRKPKAPKIPKDIKNPKKKKKKNKSKLLSFFLGSRNTKNRDLSDGGNFKIIPFTIYIVIFVASISVLLVYILDRESRYVTLNKRLFTIEQKPVVKEEKKETTPIIDTSIVEDNSDVNTIVDEATYRITEVIPRNLGTKRLNLSDFLTFITNNRSDFCKYAEQTRFAYIIANNEIRDYSSGSYPTNTNTLDYQNCMNNTVWKEADLFNLYNNLYDDFLNTTNEDPTILQKLNAAKSYDLHFNYNPVRDMPSIYKNRLLSENDFIQIFKGNYINQILFCDYSNKFAKVYDTFVSKRSGSLKPVSNCYSQNVNNQEAYTQYIFYYNYIQPTSKDVNVRELQTALIPNN